MTKTLSWPPARPQHRAGRVPRLLSRDGGGGFGPHLDRWGPMLCPADELIDEVERTGLRGRGGAGFPTAIKMGAVASRRRPLVVANGTEGEPASGKDKVLLTTAPHLVLDGISAASTAVGADEAVICVDRSASRVVDAVTQALRERRDARVDSIRIHVEDTPRRYLTGEETALVHWLNGGDAKPTTTPPRVYEKGVGRRPTLVQNVETLAHVALVARFGSAWFRELGTAADPGTALLTLSGAVGRPGVIETPLGLPVEEVVGIAGASLRDTPAVLIGGYFGTWVHAAQLAGRRLAVDDLRSIGAGMGCGALILLPPHACGLAETARVTRWLAGQSARQCGPCTNGLPAIAGAVDGLVRGDRRSEKHLLRWLDMVDGRGACRHPDGVVRLVRSAMTVFAADISEHRRRGPCRATTPIMPTPKTEGWR